MAGAFGKAENKQGTLASRRCTSSKPIFALALSLKFLHLM
jgi:hypothetical protein